MTRLICTEQTRALASSNSNFEDNRGLLSPLLPSLALPGRYHRARLSFIDPFKVTAHRDLRGRHGEVERRSRGFLSRLPSQMESLGRRQQAMKDRVHHETLLLSLHGSPPFSAGLKVWST